MSVLLSTYTNECKDYCTKEFFNNLLEVAQDHPIIIVDNSQKSGYYEYLKETYKRPNTFFYRVENPVEPLNTRFLRNVASSANLIRDKFLNSPYQGLLIVESDVIPPVSLLSELQESIWQLEEKQRFQIDIRPWGAIGGLYYKGFHDYSLQGLQETHHCLSGCTLYNRPLIEGRPFRYSMENLGAFPDAWLSMDATNNGFSLWNDHRIICDHLENSKTGIRYSHMNF